MAFEVRPRIRRAFRLALRRRDLADAEIDEELRYHIDMRVAQLIARGLTREQAETEARRRFGESWSESVRRIHEAGHFKEERLTMRETLDAIWNDLAYATRRLLRQPAFSLVVVLTFALGIGANATIFGVVDRLLLRPPPHVVHPEEVMQIGIRARIGDRDRFLGRFSYPLYDLVRADTAAFSDVIVSTGEATSTLNPGPDAEQIVTALVNGGFFTSLGARPALGRWFTPDDDIESATPAVILSYGVWQRRFSGERAIIGKVLRIGPGQFTVVGIAPPEFTGVDSRRVDAWIPISTAGALRIVANPWRTAWPSNWLLLYVRVRPGISHVAAAERVKALYTNAHESWKAASGIGQPDDPPRFALQSILPSEQLRDNPEAKISRLLVGIAALVLLIACANVANLLLARGAEQRREIAVRLALGVSRARLVRLMVAETVILACGGGIVALITAQWGVQALYLTLLEDFAMGEASLDWRVVGVTVGLVVFTTLFAGVVPAIRASRPNVTESLKAGGREGSASRSMVRTVLLATQAGLSVILVVGTGLFVQSLRHATTIPLGYEPDRVIAASLGLEALMGLESLGAANADRRARFERMRERVAAIPGVADATVASAHPLLGLRLGMRVRLSASDTSASYGRETPSYNVITDNYFRTLGIALLDGRSITSEDIATDARVAVVSQRMARSYWPNDRAVGQCAIVRTDSTCTTIVGVVADAREQVSASQPGWVIYLPATPRWDPGMNVLLVRSRDDNASRLVAPIRRAIQTSAPNLPFAEVQTFGELLAPQIRPWRIGATLFALFGGLAVVVAAVGLYSAISYSVAQRRHEFGVRMALGARVADVITLVIGQGLRAIVLGLAFGIIVALLAGRSVADMLFRTSPKDPAVFVAVSVVMALVALAASSIPARRASRVDPAITLRGD